MSTKTAYKAIFFDMDGTFLNYREFHTQVFYKFLNKYIRVSDFEEVKTHMGATVKEIFSNYGIRSQTDVQEMYQELTRFCKNDIDELVNLIPVGEGIEFVLKELNILSKC